MSTRFLTKNALIPPYMAFPRFLLNMTQLNETAKILYVMLLDRARISQKNEKWIDLMGHVYVVYTIEKLAIVMHKSETTVKTAMSTLEQADLIVRKRQGLGHPNKIYVKVPSEYLAQMDRDITPIQTENCPTERRETVALLDSKLSGNNKEMNNKKREKQKSNPGRVAYGSYKNVFLTDDELERLRQEIPQYQEYIERLSNYMQSTGKTYNDYAATIRSWHMRDHSSARKQKYECEEYESL